MTQLLVSFLYKLDKNKVFKNKGRSWEDFYVKNFTLLCAELSRQNKDFLVFTDDPMITAATVPFTNIRCIQCGIDSFKEYQRLDQVTKTRSERWIFEPEHPTYICLQNCKFEALYRASIMWPHVNIAWVDGGLRKINDDFTIRWSVDDRIRVCADNELLFRNQTIVTTFIGGSSIMGGCFGGSLESVQWLYSKSYELQSKLLSENKYTNDQGLLTILAYENPTRFWIKPQYTLYYGFFAKPYFNNVTQCLDDQIQGELYYHYTTIITPFLVLCLVLFVINYMIM